MRSILVKLFFLVQSYQLSLRKYVPFHLTFELIFSWTTKVSKFNIQRIQFMEISVLTNWRTWTTITCPFPVIKTLMCASW